MNTNTHYIHLPLYNNRECDILDLSHKIEHLLLEDI